MKTWQKATLWIGGPILFCGLSGLALWRFSDFGQAEAQLDQTIAEAIAEDLPWTAADMQQQPPVKNEANAAPKIERAGELINKQLAIHDAVFDFDRAVMDRDASAQAALMPKLPALLDLARAIGDKPACDFHHDWDEGMWLNFPELATLKVLARLLAAEADFEAQDGRVADALTDLKRCARMGKFAATDATIIAYLVSIACAKIALHGAELVAEAWHDDPHRLRALRDTLVELVAEPDLKHAFKGEVYLGISITRHFEGLRQVISMRTGSGDWQRDFAKPKRLIRDGKPATRFGRAFLCRHLQLWTRAWKELLPTKDPLKITKALDDWATDETKIGWSHILNAYMIPVMQPAGVSVMELRAQLAATRGLVVVLEFRAKVGRYPKTLAEAGFHEADPCDGKPLRYKLSGKGCRVYSVGTDKIDDGAMLKSEHYTLKPGSKTWDLAACFPAYRPPKNTAPGPGRPPMP